jgi:hypothetical protein
MKSNLIQLAEIPDDRFFYRGTRFRLYDIGLNVENKEDDYYEYMLAIIPGETEFMLLTCVEGYKSGNALALVKMNENGNAVTGKAMKFSMGSDNAYLIEENNYTQHQP